MELVGKAGAEDAESKISIVTRNVRNGACTIGTHDLFLLKNHNIEIMPFSLFEKHELSTGYYN
jgi:hypothetical protein